MTMDNKNLTSKIETLRNEILDYILSTEHYLFKWISNKEVQDFIKAYPDDYEDMIHLHVIYVSEAPKIRICFEDHPNEVEYVDRYTVLSTFKDSTKARWFEWNGMLKERQILTKEQEVKYLREQLETAEKALEYLKRN